MINVQNYNVSELTDRFIFTALYINKGIYLLCTRFDCIKYGKDESFRNTGRLRRIPS